MSAPLLCSALAIALSSTFLMIFAPFFGVKARMLSAAPTFCPRTRSATRRPFWAESLTPKSFDWTFIAISGYFFGAAGAAAGAAAAAAGGGAPVVGATTFLSAEWAL